MASEQVGDEVRGSRSRRSLFAGLALAATGTQRLADLRTRIDGRRDPVSDDQWRADVRIAENFGLVTLSGTGDETTVTRTAFGDAWAALDRSSERTGPWCLPGPGRFDVLFYPVPAHPGFPVFAATGPDIRTVRQGGWNLAGGTGAPEPNPVTQVEMVSERRDGGTFSTWSTPGDPMLSALHLAQHDNAHAVLGLVESALAERSAPWAAWPVTVDGAHHEALVLDLRSVELPPDVVGPTLLAVAHLDGATVTIISDRTADELTLTRVDADDLVGRPRPESLR